MACGFHANSSRGRSYHNEQQPTDGRDGFEFALKSTPLGLAYDEQWQGAYETNPPLVMLTGWNEWWAGRWNDDAKGQRIANTYICDPDDRFNYRWRKAVEGFTEEESYRITTDMLFAAKVGSKTAYLGSAKIDMTKNMIYREEEQMMVPLRFMADTLGLSVSWNEQRRAAFVQKMDASYTVMLDTLEIRSGREVVKTIVKPQIVNDRIYVSAEDFAKIFGFVCTYSAETDVLFLGESVSENAICPIK